ncbi:glycosyltransferase [Lentzea tibetensis]|uniref:Glycosyltransferase n=1 Tax=Lentzea tibetensis TaxID=2591470 RepID=A0A563EKG9_9PSEU|nr:glycosyltransferase [Lentzea tibetensis]TWP47549.1 glycosyltransferase [Lentzea tibetensis]
MTGPSFAHLARLSDDTGLHEHARGPLPRREHGYCLDDVARGLVVLCREPELPADLVVLVERYLAFTAHAQAGDGRFHNRLGPDRRWQDEPGLGDWWGRALWGLGTAAARCPAPWIRTAALACFDTSAHHRPPSVRSMAFAALGAAEVLTAAPDHALAAKLLGDVAAYVGEPSQVPDWPWPERRLFYANAALPEALIAAGDLLADRTVRDDGLRLLTWLLTVESRDGHLSPTPAGGWRVGEARPAFGQQPIEVAALADACARAHRVTGDREWLIGVRRAVAWFGGDNDIGEPLHDPETGGGRDGLERDGCSRNQGAESTLALISTLQHGRALLGSAG